MCKKIYITFMLINGFLTTLQPMEILLRSPQFKPQHFLGALWYAYKPVLYTSITFAVGGYFLYDFFYKRELRDQNKQLRIDIQTLSTDFQELKERTSTTGVLSELARVEAKYSDVAIKVKELEGHLEYLWRFLFGNRIKAFNEIENKNKPYDRCPHIPQLDDGGVSSIIKSVCCLPPEEPTYSNHIPSPRNTNGSSFKIVPCPRSGIPQGKSRSPSPEISSSPSDSSDEEDRLVPKNKRKGSNDTEDPKRHENPVTQQKASLRNTPQKKGDE